VIKKLIKHRRYFLFGLVLTLICGVGLARPFKHLYERVKCPWLPPTAGLAEYHATNALRTPSALLDFLRYGNADFSKKKTIALTFDDGPYPLYTPLLLDVLAKYNVHATFFVVGNSVRDYPHLLRLIKQNGHEIANHTYTHRRQRDISLPEFREELLKTEDAIADTIGERPRLFRPAGGSVTEDARLVVQDLGYTLCNATVNPGDWWQRDPDKLILNSYRGRSREGVTLMHSGTMGIIRAMPGYINALKAKGFNFTTMTDLSQQIGCPIPPNPRPVKGHFAQQPAGI
jgi:peptidoglycan-N-acetylglucosamine deacetylase